MKSARELPIEYTRELVIAKVRQCFRYEPEGDILAILDLYGTSPGAREIARVQLAILKLSDGKIEKLRSGVAAANRDYRDVLAWAEYPEEMRKDTWAMNDEEAVRKITERDRKQYLDWLHARD